MAGILLSGCCAFPHGPDTLAPSYRTQYLHPGLWPWPFDIRGDIRFTYTQYLYLDGELHNDDMLMYEFRNATLPDGSKGKSIMLRIDHPGERTSFRTVYEGYMDSAGHVVSGVRKIYCGNVPFSQEELTGNMFYYQVYDDLNTNMIATIIEPDELVIVGDKEYKAKVYSSVWDTKIWMVEGFPVPVKFEVEDGHKKNVYVLESYRFLS